MSNSEKFWDRAASTHDRAEEGDEPTHARAIEETRKYLETGDMVLDFGCGIERKHYYVRCYRFPVKLD